MPNAAVERAIETLCTLDDEGAPIRSVVDAQAIAGFGPEGSGVMVQVLAGHEVDRPALEAALGVSVTLEVVDQSAVLLDPGVSGPPT